MPFCTQPFNRIEIFEDGNVYNCCPQFVSYYSIGNIYQTPFDEIWNGEKAIELRRKILNNDYSLCDDICNRKVNNDINENGYNVFVEKYPEEISISTDNICNIRCRMCRDKQMHTEYNKDNVDEEIKKIWLPILKDARIVRFGCTGEPFASYKEIKLIQSAAQTYPNLKFHFHTNGILGTEEKLKELKVFNRIEKISISLHCASRETYNKIILDGNYDKVMSNIKLYSNMRKNNLIKEFRLIFVVFSENYKEMPDFVKLAKENNAKVEFWALRLNENTQIGQKFDDYSVINPKHKEHNQLIEILKQPIFQDRDVKLYPELMQLI